MGAVSMRLMPRSRALRQVATATHSGTAPQSSPPMAQVPRPIRETFTPAMVVVSMHNIISSPRTIDVDSHRLFANIFHHSIFIIYLIDNSAANRMLSCMTMLRRFEPSQRQRRLGLLAGIHLLLILTAESHASAFGQTAGEVAAQVLSGRDSLAQTKPVVLTLAEAIKRAEGNEPLYAASLAESLAAGQERWVARKDLLPSVVYHNQAVYTQTDRGATVPRFIANNAAREYASQAVVNETLGLGRLAAARRADAAEARAAAELEIARRGLVAAVTSLYYGAIAAENKQAIAERAHAEAKEFSGLAGTAEQAREAAHADVVKAQVGGERQGGGALCGG